MKLLSASQWIDALKEKKQLKTDSECAKILKVEKQTISHWRRERFQIGIEDCFTLGKVLEINPLFIITCSKYHSDKTEKQKNWEKLAYMVDIKNTLKEGTEDP
jgi:hypothetical protein